MIKIKKVIFILIFAIAFILIGTGKSQAGSLYLNNLDFNVEINRDGSMDVTETWDIDISRTNTLYKVFETDFSKYSEITNVTVKEITSRKNFNFTKTDEWAYHVTKNHYYGTENQDGDFEIGWGVGLDNSSDTREYEISYTVVDAIAKYSDFAELYWQFVGNDFEIYSDKITGTIYLPSNVSNKEDIRVWGHTEDLNGTIYATDLNKIEFELDNVQSGKYVEIRTLFPTELISSSGRTKNTEILQTVLEEESEWAEEANARRERQQWIDDNLPDILTILFFGINIVLIIVFVRKIKKYSKELKELNLIGEYKPTINLEYFRDLPDEKTTPGEAVKILNVDMQSFTATNFGKVFSATMLDLALKGLLEIKEEQDEKGKEIITIYILKQVTDELKPSQKCIMEFIIKASDGKTVITLKELQKYIESNTSKTQKLLKDTYDNIDKQLKEEKIIDEEVEKKYIHYKQTKWGYITIILLLVIFLSFLAIAITIPIILLIINSILCGKIAKKLNVLTQKGVDMKEQWKGLKKYMEEFSLLDRREVPELIIWEKYLVYATAFGIADKVIKQLKMVYPNFEELTNGVTTYAYMNTMMHTNFSSTFSNSINKSIASATYSSSSGGGGGFSGGGGGGGGRWWRRPEDNDLKGE